MIAYPALSPDQSRQQFPRKLYDLLQNSNPAIVSWLVDGMSFYVQDEAQFCSTVLPVYFAHNFGTRGARTSSPEVEDRARALTLFNLVAGFLKRLYHRKRVKLTI